MSIFSAYFKQLLRLYSCRLDVAEALLQLKNALKLKVNVPEAWQKIEEELSTADQHV